MFSGFGAGAALSCRAGCGAASTANPKNYNAESTRTISCISKYAVALRRVDAIASAVVANKNNGENTTSKQDEKGSGTTPVADINSGQEVDVLIVGGGAGGLAVAATLLEETKKAEKQGGRRAANEGSTSLSIRLLEKSGKLGGSDNLWTIIPPAGAPTRPTQGENYTSQTGAQAVAVFSDGYVGVNHEDPQIGYQLVKPRKALVVACGSRPGYAIFPGNDLPGVVFWEQAARLRKYNGKKVVVIGGTREAARITTELLARGAHVSGLVCPPEQNHQSPFESGVQAVEQSHGVPVFRRCRVLGARKGTKGPAVGCVVIAGEEDKAAFELEASMVVVAIEKIPALELADKARQFGKYATFVVQPSDADSETTAERGRRVALQILELEGETGGENPWSSKGARMAERNGGRRPAAATCGPSSCGTCPCKTDGSPRPATCSGGSTQTKEKAPCTSSRTILGTHQSSKPRQASAAEVSALQDIEDTAIVCRCERVSLGEIRSAIEKQPDLDMNRIKQMTRQGMGYCGGYQCTAAVKNIIEKEYLPIRTSSPAPNTTAELQASSSSSTSPVATGTRSEEDLSPSSRASAHTQQTPLDLRHQRPLNLELPVSALAKTVPAAEPNVSAKPQLPFEADTEAFDVIILGAGAIGLPTALALKDHFARVLVLDGFASAGQGDNKRALGGVRATFGNPGKIMVGKESVNIFRNWKKDTGDDIDWKDGGYLFPFYSEQDEQKLVKLLPTQRRCGLEIGYVSKEKVQELVPGIESAGLRGGVYSPGDGQATPYLASASMMRLARAKGVDFRFKHTVVSFLLGNGRDDTANKHVTGVVVFDQTTGRLRKFRAAVRVVNCLGASCNEVVSTLGHTLPLIVDSHDAAVTSPVVFDVEQQQEQATSRSPQKIRPLVVDIRNFAGSSCFYFYQNLRNQLVLSNAPFPAVTGFDTDETAHFLPQLAQRLLALLPKCGEKVLVRRVWRGLYANTADGNPLVGEDAYYTGLMHACGMGGQGFMLGPGVGSLLARVLTGRKTVEDEACLQEFNPGRKMDGAAEALR